MSLYHQASMMTHGQPYGAPPYGHAPPTRDQQRGAVPYQHYAGRYPTPTPMPPLQPMYHMDANSFRDEYMRRLASLTENSRPIIQNLLLFAQEYPRWSDIVGQCIQAHIRSVPPWVKLPAFYVLDCISKNVFEPYAKTFSSFIAPLFLNVYAEVDPTTKRKMEEMLLTWRKGSPDGRELFGVHVQVAIERGIWGAQGSSATNTPVVHAGQVLSELEYSLGHMQRMQSANPYDTKLKTDVETMLQLKSFVEGGLSQAELRQILDQVRAMAPPPTSVAQSRSRQPVPAPAPHVIPSSSYEQHASAAALPPFSAPLPAPPQAPVSALNFDPSRLQGLMSAMSALAKTGALKTPAGSQSDTPEPSAPSKISEASSSNGAGSSRAKARTYRQQVLSRPVKLNGSDILRQRPSLVHLQYDSLRAQCTQCGLRFSDDAAGKKDLQEHLDSHFKQNRKVAQSSGRGHNRSWFVVVDDWIHESAVDVKGKGRADGTRKLSQKELAAAEASKRDSELRAKYVVVPAGDEAKTIKCPICKESIHPVFSEDHEEWMWRNAIEKDGKIFHATCHAEAITSANTLVTRLKTEASGSSRSTTPLRATPPKVSGSPSAGTKRKADVDVKTEPDDTPLSKKVALSA